MLIVMVGVTVIVGVWVRVMVRVWIRVRGRARFVLGLGSFLWFVLG